MASGIYEASVVIGADLSGLDRQMAGAGGQITSRMGAIGAAAGTAFSSALTIGATAGLAALAGGGFFAKWSVGLASDAEEAGSKFGFVFGAAVTSVTEDLDSFAKAAGRSKFAMRSMAADVGALIGPMGFSADQTGKLSTQVVKLATDLSSFFNVSEGDALTALRSAIVGESEPMRRLGVQLNEAKIQAEAFKLGLAKTKAEVTGAIKTQAILSIIMRETAVAQGDAIRTAGSYSNTMRALSGSIQDAGTIAGQLFLPAFTEIAAFIRSGIEPINKHADTFKAWGLTIGEITRNVLKSVGELSSKVSAFFAESFNQLVSRATGGAAKSVSEFVTQSLSSLALLTTDFSKTWDLAKELAGVAFREMQLKVLQFANTAKSILLGVFGGLKVAMGEIFEVVSANLKLMGIDLQKILGGLMGAFDALYEHMTSRLKKISAVLGGVAESMFAAFSASEGKGVAPENVITKGYSKGEKAVTTAKQSEIDTQKSLVAKIATGFMTGFQQSFVNAQSGNDPLANTIKTLESQQKEAFARIMQLMLGMQEERAKLNQPPPAPAAEAPKLPPGFIAGLVKSAGSVLGKIDPKEVFKGAGEAIGGAAGKVAEVLGPKKPKEAEGKKPAQVEFSGIADMNKRLQTALNGNSPEKKSLKNSEVIQGLTKQLLEAMKQAVAATRGVDGSIKKMVPGFGA